MQTETIRLLDGIDWSKDELLTNMEDDSFYYGYLSKAALSSSALKPLLISAQEYYDSLRFKQEDQSFFRDGKIFHTIALEPEMIEKRYELVDYKRRVASVRELDLASEKEVILQKEFDEMNQLYTDMIRCEDAAKLLDGGISEIPAIGEINGIPFRGKADYLRFDHIVDLKTTSNLKGWVWNGKSKYNYDAQAYIYMNLFNVNRFTFLVVEKKTAKIGIYELSEASYESGKRKVEKATERYKKFFMGKSDQEILDGIHNDYQYGEF